MSRGYKYMVGASSVDITPALDRTVYLAGFATGRKARSVLHPLEAGVLYIADPEGGELCLVTVDLIGLLQPKVEELRDRVADVLPRERLIVACTHTHSGPDSLGLWGPGLFGAIPLKSGVDPDYLATVVDRIAATVKKAKDGAEPATLHAVTFHIPAGWVRNDRKDGGSYPRTVALLARAGGEIRSLMLNFSAHPEALWEKNPHVSPDYPGPFRTWLRKLGVPRPLFFSGPLGAMLTPDVPPRAKLKERIAYVERFGEVLARTTMEEIKRAEPLAGLIKVAEKKLVLKNANKTFEFARDRGLLDRPIDDNRIKTRMAAGSIGNFRFVTVPGEPSPEVGHQIYTEQKKGHRMILCLGLDELGYIIPSSFFGHKEYKYERSMSVGPDLGPTVVDTTRELVEELA